jgi:YggT family protein
MFVIGNLLTALAMLLHYVILITTWVLIINAVLSWVRPDPGHPIVVLLDRISDVVCSPIRRVFPTVYSGFDFAPLIAILVLQFVGDMFLVRTLQDLAIRM